MTTKNKNKQRKNLFISVVEESGLEIMQKILREFENQNCFYNYYGLMKDTKNNKSLFPVNLLARNGIWDVLVVFPMYLWVLAKCLYFLFRFPPDLVILVDFPAFNKILGKYCVKKNIPVYYISPPQIWVYHRRCIDPVFKDIPVHVLFPFEKKYYESYSPITSQGHFFTKNQSNLTEDRNQNKKKGLGLFPGSRLPIIVRNLPKMLQLIKKQNQFTVYLIIPLSLHVKVKRKFTLKGIILSSSLNCIVAKIQRAISFPGTMTLHLALNKIPTFVFAKIDFLTFYGMRKKVKIKLVSLPNILWKQEVFPEFIYCFSTKRIQGDLKKKWNLFLKTECNVPDIDKLLGCEQGEKKVAKQCIKMLK